MIEAVIVYGVVAVAALVVARRFLPRRARPTGGGCSCGKGPAH